jgi:hypothetical protein
MVKGKSRKKAQAVRVDDSVEQEVAPPREAVKRPSFIEKVRAAAADVNGVTTWLIVVATALLLTFRSEVISFVGGGTSMRFVSESADQRQLVVHITNNGRESVLVEDYNISAPGLKGVLDFGQLSPGFGQPHSLPPGRNDVGLAISHIDAMSKLWSSPDQFFRRFGQRRVVVRANANKVWGSNAPLECSFSINEVRGWLEKRVTLPEGSNP